MESLLRFQIDFQRKFGCLEELEKTEEKLANLLIKQQEEMGFPEKNQLKKGSKIKSQKFLNNKRKHQEIEEEYESFEPGLQKKAKTMQKPSKTIYKDTKFIL